MSYDKHQKSSEFLDNSGISKYINKKYKSLEDRFKAFQGALLGYHTSKNKDKKEWLDRSLQWYANCKNNFNDPFYDGLRKTLDKCNISDFYEEMVKFIEGGKY